MLGQGGKPRDEDAALLLIQEFRSGKIGRITMEKPLQGEQQSPSPTKEEK